jgi:hypothetical protein
MPILTTIMYEVQCDECGDLFGEEETTRAGAVRQAVADGWTVLRQPKKYLCRKCSRPATSPRPALPKPKKGERR